MSWTETLVDLLANFGIIFVLAGLWNLSLEWKLREHKLPRRPTVAVVASACAILLMSFPIEVVPGVIFDLRTVPVVLGGLFGGPLVGLAVGAIAAVYRLAIGGMGALPAMAGMALITVLGMTAGHVLKGRIPSTSALLVVAAAAAAANMVGPLLLPADIRWQILEQVTLPAMGIVFVALLFVGKMVANTLERRQIVKDLRVTEERLSEANTILADLARVDGLTGIANRRAFDEALMSELKRSQRTVAPLSLLMIDVDNFKSFNDRYGHLAGDNCLRTIVALIRSALQRPGDIVARFGGEEFAVLLPATDAAGAAAVAERIRSAIAGLSLPHEGAAMGIVTVSIGVATATGPRDALNPQTLTREADEALYKAKADGRNKVVVCEGGYAQSLKQASG